MSGVMVRGVDFRTLLTIALFCVEVSNVYGVSRDHNHALGNYTEQFTQRIVGGTQASVGEYPYFVQTRRGGCGGVLVASEWVLTAVHCGDITNQEVMVGPYRNWSTEYGAKKRKCTLFRRDPGFEYDSGSLGSPNAPYQKDAALCKLDTPVYVDDSKVGFRLNGQNNYPATGTDVVAIGFGTLKAGGSQPTFLQEVTVKVNSNNYCASAPASIYNSQSISSGIICASVPGGGKDACQGDSGGPLFRKEFINGKRVDTHVGITSWGVGCAEREYPGVYSRTAYSYNFVRSTICSGGNPHPFCQTPVSCRSNQEKLVIRVVPDGYPQDISYKLSRNGGGTVHLRPQNYFQKRYFTYEDSICLDKGEAYTFTMIDSHGDALTTGEKGFYSLTLNGKMIARGSDYGSQDTRIIRTESLPNVPATDPPSPNPTSKPTPSPVRIQKRGPCDDRIGWRFNNNPEKTCDALFKGKKKRSEVREICNTKDPSRDRRVKHFCASHCRKKCRNKTQTNESTKKSGQKMNRDDTNRNQQMNRTMTRNRNRKPVKKRRQKPEGIVSI